MSERYSTQKMSLERKYCRLLVQVAGGWVGGFTDIDRWETFPGVNRIGKYMREILVPEDVIRA